MAAALIPPGQIYPALLCELTFRSQSSYTWTGVGPLMYAGNTYLGMGSLGKMAGIQEGVEVQADGTSVTLSGIDPFIRAECMTDIQQGAPAAVYFALITPQLTVIGTPYQIFAGTVDVPTVSPGADTISISLSLENRLIDLARPNNRLYTSCDQQLYFPTDIGFSWVEQLNDIALVWGQ
jgi:hypothetical protein